MNDEGRIYYYCPNCACIWYVGDDEQNKFYAWSDDLSDYEFESLGFVKNKDCGCIEDY